jgi:hypothetical protein
MSPGRVGVSSDDIASPAEPEPSKVDALSETGVSHDDIHIETDLTDDKVDVDVRFPSDALCLPHSSPFPRSLAKVWMAIAQW